MAAWLFSFSSSVAWVKNTADTMYKQLFPSSSDETIEWKHSKLFEIGHYSRHLGVDVRADKSSQAGTSNPQLRG